MESPPSQIFLFFFLFGPLDLARFFFSHLWKLVSFEEDGVLFDLLYKSSLTHRTLFLLYKNGSYTESVLSLLGQYLKHPRHVHGRKKSLISSLAHFSIHQPFLNWNCWHWLFFQLFEKDYFLCDLGLGQFAIEVRVYHFVPSGSDEFDCSVERTLCSLIIFFLAVDIVADGLRYHNLKFVGDYFLFVIAVLNVFIETCLQIGSVIRISLVFYVVEKVPSSKRWEDREIEAEVRAQ